MQSNKICERCGKPIQYIYKKFRGKERRFAVTCSCILERKKSEKRISKEQDIIFALKARGFSSGINATMTLKTWKDIGIEEQLDKYRENIKLDKKNWLYLCGDNGLGKTHMAYALTRQIAVDHLWEPAAIQWAEYCSKMQQSYENNFIENEWKIVREVRILMIDDLDKKLASPGAMGQLYELIDYRYRFNIPTILTANHTINELKKLWIKDESIKDLGKAIISRIKGCATEIKFTGKDYRTEKNI
ncbi:ATP-binding protein [Desulfonema magnum]|nr:ATP-binding protein [Desulfonema magnum]